MRTCKGFGVSLSGPLYKRVSQRVKELGISRSTYIQLALINEMDQADREALAKKEKSLAVSLGISTPAVEPRKK